MFCRRVRRNVKFVLRGSQIDAILNGCQHTKSIDDKIKEKNAKQVLRVRTLPRNTQQKYIYCLKFNFTRIVQFYLPHERMLNNFLKPEQLLFSARDLRLARRRDVPAAPRQNVILIWVNKYYLNVVYKEASTAKVKPIRRTLN